MVSTQNSRLIVRNLPANFTDVNLRAIFQKYGTITDASLRYTSTGAFRRFAYVGFEDDSSCELAISKTNNTFYNGLKLLVEKCKRFDSNARATKLLRPISDKPIVLSPNKKKRAKLTFAKNETESDETKEVKSTNMETEEKILDTGRLFIRNLAYSCTEDDLTNLFKNYGVLNEVQCIIYKNTGKCKGFGIVTFMFPENALNAFKELDGTIFKGRVLHVLPGEEKNERDDGNNNQLMALSQFQKEKNKELKSSAIKAKHTWNTLFLGSNAVADKLAEKFDLEKRHLLLDDGENSTAIRMAMAETQLVKRTREFFLSNGVKLDAFSHPAAERSKVVIIVKNLSSQTTTDELRELFSRQGEVKDVLMPPERGISAIVEMGNEVDAKKAFTRLTYYRLKNLPLYLEWAPSDVFSDKHYSRRENTIFSNTKQEKVEKDMKLLSPAEVNMSSSSMSSSSPDAKKEDETDQQGRTKMLVRNVPFQATRDEVRQLFSAFGEIKFIRMPQKPGTANEHRGFCFVDFIAIGDAKRAFEALVHSTHLYGRRLVLEWAKKDDSLDELFEKNAKKLLLGNRKRKGPLSKKQLNESVEKAKLTGLQ